MHRIVVCIITQRLKLSATDAVGGLQVTGVGCVDATGCSMAA